MTEGYIKFNCRWEKQEIQLPAELSSELNAYRTKLRQLNLIGIYPDGIGYGNISVRMEPDNSFLITGSATGQFEQLESRHFAFVSAYSFEENSIQCTGLTKASAESLSHAAVYEAISETGAVVHIHCYWLWEKLLNKYPTTSPEIEYGTPEMALQIVKIASEMKESKQKIIVMGGHREGILSFGPNLHDATNEIIKIFNQYKHD